MFTSVRALTANFALAWAIGASASVEPLTTSDLERYCAALADGSEDGRYCMVLLQGYLAGSGIGDRPGGQSRNEHPLQAPADETFEERAVRTRLGPRYRADHLEGGVCVGPDLSTEQVATTIAPFIAAGVDGEELVPSELVHRALVRHFSCRR